MADETAADDADEGSSKKRKVRTLVFTPCCRSACI
jgi:hypothetical protein